MEQYPGLYELLWFFGGVFTYRLFTTLLTYGQLTVLVKGVSLQAMTLLAHAAEDISFIKQMRNQIAEEGGYSEEQLKILKLTDERIFDVWKSSVVSRLTTHWAKPFDKVIKIQTWASIMDAVSGIYKESIWKKLSN
tara:strand:- start:1602 stop:2009 length:408 start_codon:yes stop_codon:yes gene_type:complete